MPYQILVVDDEPDMESLVRQKLRQQIRDNEFEFFFSRNGEEALQTLAGEPGIDLVLTDINMPVMDGLTLLGRLNEFGKPMKTVIVSAYGDMANIRTAMNRGAIDFLTKPIDFADFELTIRKGLAHIARVKKSIETQDDLIALQHELNVAARIQQWTMPRTFPPFPERHDFELHAAMAPAKGVSGDLFDYFLLDKTHLAFMIGDVNGTGVAAALFAAITRTLLRATAQWEMAPGACLKHLEAALADQQDASMCPTLFYGVLDTRSGELQFANNGHSVPYLYSEAGGAKPLHGVSVKSDDNYRTGMIQMKPGDGLLLYTDGVTEAPNGDRQWFGDVRLKEHVNLHASSTAERMVLDLFTSLRFFSPGTAQNDDITVMALRYRG
ncbi:MAG: SpoIIE family protein phosphatase [Bryobacteraceae bacterium]|jgi:sigma-B regulation protein RsbU (phosphoserine phosphatase)